MSKPNDRNHEERTAEKSFGERVAEARAEVPAITPLEAKQRQERDPKTLFLDPRDAAGIASSTGIIPGALNVTLGELTERDDADLPEAMVARARPIITACQAGPMGALAAHVLKRRGFTNVCFMDGGTQAWLDAGYATER